MPVWNLVNSKFKKGGMIMRLQHLEKNKGGNSPYEIRVKNLMSIVIVDKGLENECPQS